MEKSKERYSITVGDGGLEIRGGKGNSLSFTAAEALMLLDILKNEEEKLRHLADQASPRSSSSRLRTLRHFDRREKSSGSDRVSMTPIHQPTLK